MSQIQIQGWSSPPQVTQSVDNNPPSVFQSALTASLVTTSSMFVEWQLATDVETENDTIFYTLYQSDSSNIGSIANMKANGTPIFSASNASGSFVTNLSSSQTYYHNVIAKDTNDNELGYTELNTTTNSSASSGLDSQAGDEIALQDFYTAMDGPNWDNNTGWSADSIDLDVSMDGVVTHQVGGETRVKELNLSGGGGEDRDDIIGENLTGDSVPDSFGNLKQMTHLRLKGNNITARVDNWIQSLTSIVRISLSASSGFTGQREFELDDRVEYNHSSKNNASYNKWEGPLPDDLSMLTNLDLLEIANSNLSGTLPTQLPDNIRGFIVTNNKMSGALPAWANCTSMTHLYLGTRYDGGPWTGQIPSEWGNMTNMAWFDLEAGFGETELTGGLPDFSSWNDLRLFKINGHDQLEPEVPNYFWLDDGRNEFLHTFNAGFTGMTGSFNETGFSGLVVLYIPECNMTGQIPEWIDDDDLVQIALYDNDFSGPFPDQGFNDQLRWIRIENNSFTGSLPGIDPTIQELQELRLQNNQFSGDIPSSYGEIPSSADMDNLRLDNNLLDGTIPLGIFGKGWNIRLDDNKYTPKNLVPILGENLSGVTYLPQKNFGDADSYSAGDTIDFSSYNETDNTYQWYKDDVSLSGETSSTIDTTSHGAGTYHMEIENTNIDYTFTSEDQTVS